MLDRHACRCYNSRVRSLSFMLGIVSAALFGVATPISKLLLQNLSQFQLAGLLYLGAALGMFPFLLARRRRINWKTLGRRNGLRVAGSVLFGGCLGPVFLLLGLSTAHASSVSLWLNLELAATAVLGFLFFRDHLDLKGWIGVGGVLFAGALVTFSEGWAGITPALFVALACVCWGIDNNLTSLIDGLTPQESTFIKGVVAGSVNFSIGVALQHGLPGGVTVLAALILGAVCYGGSIVLYISAAQGLGATRGQILFASAPFFGLLFSILLLAERPGWAQLAAVPLLLASLFVMLSARHAHRHAHQMTYHVHLHRHDDQHHDHRHEQAPASRWHVHAHTHDSVVHEHAHVPDLHHRHEHVNEGPDR
jgi:drug/metabolite transporter (DMT)-like permease